MIYLYQAVQSLYWLTLASWLGSMIFLAAGAPVVFRTARDLDVRVPRYSSAHLADQQGTIVGGAIVGSLLVRLAQIQTICAVVMLPLLLLQFAVADMNGVNLTVAILRLVLWLSATGLLVYEVRSHSPRMWQLRETYLQHADEAEIAEPAKAAFDHEHHRAELLYQATVFILVGMVMFSVNLTPRAKPMKTGGNTGVAIPQ